jgi:predicted transcriptional regulator
MGRIEITESQILEALRAALDRGESEGVDGYTTVELVELTGLSDKRVRRAIHILVDQGVVEEVMVKRRKLGGYWAPRLGFRWIERREDVGHHDVQG